MRKTRKLLALVLAILMAIALTVPALADDPVPQADTSGSTALTSTTITVTNAKPGETYKLYKMLDLKVDDASNPQAYTYTVRTDWESFKTEYADIWSTVFNVDEGGYVTVNGLHPNEQTWSPTSSVSKFAEAAAKYADENLTPMQTVTVEADANQVVFNTGKAGYYLITSTLDARAIVDTTPGSVTIAAKHHDNSVLKEIKEHESYVQSNNVQIGSVIEFRTTVVIYPRSVNVKIHDTMDAGLTLTPNSISIKLLNDDNTTTALATDYYEILGTPDDGDTFTIKIKDTFSGNTQNAPAKDKARTLYVTYTATLNENAISDTPAIVEQSNKAKITYGDATSKESTTTTTTHKFAVFKHTTGSSNDNLAGAVFALRKSETSDNIKAIPHKDIGRAKDVL